MHPVMIVRSPLPFFVRFNASRNGNLLENSNGRSSAGPERVLARRGAHLLRELEERVVGGSANVQLERLA